MASKEELLEKVYVAMVDIDEEKTIEIVKEWSNNGYDPLTLLNKLSDAMVKVGEKFEKMEYYLPQVMIASEIMESASKIISEKLVNAGESLEVEGTVVIGTIEGDIHDLGKNIVAGMLKASNFKVIDLGRDVPVASMVKTAKDHEADIIAGSALMTTTMPYLGDIVKLLNGMGIRDKFKVMVGGAPLSPEYASKIGADIFAKNSHEAVEAAKKLIRK